MKTIIDFLSNTYFIFIFLALVSIFALIGYFIELKHPEEEKKEKNLETTKLDETELLKAEIKDKELTLNNYMKNSNSKSEELNPKDFQETAINSKAKVESLDTNN